MEYITYIINIRLYDIWACFEITNTPQTANLMGVPWDRNGGAAHFHAAMQSDYNL